MSNNNFFSLTSWIEVPANSDFPIQNIPFGVFKTADSSPRVGVAIGEQVLDIYPLAESGLLNTIPFDHDVLNRAYLNDFIALGKPNTKAIRERLLQLLSKDNAELRDNASLRAKAFHKIKDVQLLLPVKVGDYTDFYSSKEHATNVGSMFRNPAEALLPNWKHLPVAYHGRASSIVVSGTPLKRPKGQTKSNDDVVPKFGYTKALDFELEMAFVIGKESPLGQSISTKEAEEYIFGFMLFNDWSARDIQTWEYVPLGPFLSKNFMSSVSPWVVTMEALEPFRTQAPEQDVKVLPYLEYEGEKNFDIALEVYLKSSTGAEKKIADSNFKYMYWNICQQLAHHTINGCNINVGDLMASGTISGPTKDSYGSMLELTWRGANPIQLPDGTERKFLEDGDTVTIKGFAQKNGMRVGFGEVKGEIVS